ncbi:MAG TPA: DNA mismatch endonuclease Vsr [Puia sp.]|jgi:DNA mismatch endonuclease (patch repair protein)
MSDVHSAAVRSYNMSRIRSKDTKPELIVRKILFSRGFRFRLHRSDLPGKPDIVLPKYKTVVFVHGCFWHGHEGCKYFVVPKSRTEWWLNKINRNKELDEINAGKLQSMGWKVIQVFECGLKKGEVEKMGEWLVQQLRKGGE